MYPEDSGLKAGMSADADIVLDERQNVLLVPNRAIGHDSQGNPIVKVILDEQVEERRVVLGITDGLDTEVIEGLTAGEVIVRTAG